MHAPVTAAASSDNKKATTRPRACGVTQRSKSVERGHAALAEDGCQCVVDLFPNCEHGIADPHGIRTLPDAAYQGCCDLVALVACCRHVVNAS